MILEVQRWVKYNYLVSSKALQRVGQDFLMYYTNRGQPVLQHEVLRKDRIQERKIKFLEGGGW